MKTKLHLTILLALFGLSINAQTNVGGTLASNTTWTISGSPYNVTSNLGVPLGITLTIDAGVTVNFNTNYQIIIQGILIANGNNGNPITFNGNITGSSMILFQKTNLNNSSLSYITVNGPKDGIKLSNNNSDNNSGTLTINNLTITNSKIETNGYDSNAKLVINNSTITNSKTYGDYPRSEVININNCYISGGEIISYAYNHGIFLNNDTCINTLFASGCCDGNVNIFLSYINDASFNQASGSQSGSSNYLTIDNSQIYNTIVNMPVSTVTINNSTLNYDINYSNSSCIVSGNGIIDSTIFTGNGSLIAIERGASGNSYDNNSTYTITHCTFTNFGSDININADYSSAFGSGDVSINYCDFLDSPPNYIINNTSPHDASAMYNWWGTTVTSIIDNSIYDYWDDMADGKVIYTNFLSGPINTTVGIQTLASNSNNAISIFPNPFSLETTLKSNDNFNNATLTIYNSSGQEVKNIQNIQGQTIKLHRDNLPSGLYFIRLTKDNNTYTTEKLVITDI